MADVEEAIQRAMRTTDPEDIRAVADLLEGRLQFQEALEWRWWDLHLRSSDPAARSRLQACQAAWSVWQSGVHLFAAASPELQAVLEALERALGGRERVDQAIEELEAAFLEWLDLPVDLTQTLERCHLPGLSSQESCRLAARLLSWLSERTGDPGRLREDSAYCELLAGGYELLERWEARSQRMLRAFQPLRLALDRRASREDLERALREVQREVRYSRPEDGPDPGLGVPRAPHPPRLPDNAYRLERQTGWPAAE